MPHLQCSHASVTTRQMLGELGLFWRWIVIRSVQQPARQNPAKHENVSVRDRDAVHLDD
jgi:hypothetical protein